MKWNQINERSQLAIEIVTVSMICMATHKFGYTLRSPYLTMNSSSSSGFDSFRARVFSSILQSINHYDLVEEFLFVDIILIEWCQFTEKARKKKFHISSFCVFLFSVTLHYLQLVCPIDYCGNGLQNKQWWCFLWSLIMYMYIICPCAHYCENSLEYPVPCVEKKSTSDKAPNDIIRYKY